ncbi:hypothetical protein [Celeribacter persicus]|uniref:Capsular polysaccharide transport system permease protein n=1 Tax=Celeribacter persicus TaxID=1651082 RepID=A0A2T5HTS8_9RHOB|nr:hypothetical protein [Celeribacter persicus]PTQ74999.1 capsular polysaccharide transport system permease protein [Celeribacter persicus]
MRKRHRFLFLSFLLCTILPVLLAVGYIWGVARDQYASRIAFSVRSAQSAPALEILGGMSQLGGADSLDSEILADFIHSQALVEELDARLNLRGIYACLPEQKDIVFCLYPQSTVEDLVAYWRRVVSVSYDGGAGILEIEVRAFDPIQAQDVANGIFDLSSMMINNLASSAREDATRYARQELDIAVQRLKTARKNLASFRSETQIMDPEVDLSGQMGVIANLQEQLTDALIDRGMIAMTTTGADPRIEQLDRKIKVIEHQLDVQRQKFGPQMQDGKNAYADLIGQFEELSVEVEFAEKSYLQAMTALDVAMAEASHRSRYLAAHVRPTLAQTSEYPKKFLVPGMVLFFAFFIWMIGILVYYSLRDRR